MRFGLVGCVNTTIDLLVLNGLLWPEQGTARLLLFNTLAYACGALNSFVFNRYWTFQRPGRPNAREGARFLLVTLAAIACNDLILWLMSKILLLAVATGLLLTASLAWFLRWQSLALLPPPGPRGRCLMNLLLVDGIANGAAEALYFT